MKLPTWITGLEEEELSFIRRLVLSSGSLKEVAQNYGVSYPTVRLKLDRIIQKIKLIEQNERSSSFEQTIRSRFIDGRIDEETMKVLLEAHRNELLGEK